jgi:NADH-quinone oxidoreductase subunit L
MHGVYLHAPEASHLIACIGAATAFFAATVALVQTDIKKVLAYSTLSQLGFMFVALGVGAYGVAVFHLYTHAFFKACLFLGAGSVIHALGGKQDIMKMGGLSRRIPVTFWTFAIATAAIAGLPPLAGFFSKDEILWFALASEHGGSPALFAVMALTALLTSFYMFRLLWLTFLGAPRMDAATAHHVHESPPSMTAVLALLALLSAVGGFLAIPHVLEPVLPLAAAHEEMHALEQAVVAGSVLIALLGLAGAAFCYRGDRAPAARFAATFAGAGRVLFNKYYIDELYERVLNRPLVWMSERVFLQLGDRVLLDGSLHGLARGAQGAATGFARVQTGNLQFYLLLALAGLVALLGWGLGHG